MTGLDRTCNVTFGMFCVIDGIVLLSNIAMLYKFIKQHKSQNDVNKIKKKLFYIGIIFIILIICTQILMLVIVGGGCKDIEEVETHETVINVLWALCYLFQSYLLSMITFMTLQQTFNETPFKLASRTVIVYKLIYIFIPILVIFTVALNRTLLGAVLMAFSLLFLALFFLSIIILFITKLMAVYKHIDSDNNLIVKITKLTVLSVISILLTLFLPLLIMCILLTNPSYVLASAALMYGTLIDTTTNLYCIILTYPYFNNYYVKVCGCLHSQCFVLWAKCLGQQQRLLMVLDNDNDDDDEDGSDDNKNSKIQTGQVIHAK